MTINYALTPITATGATASRTHGDRWADVVNVKDYGAKGDGVTNDGAALQAALDAAYGPHATPNSLTGHNERNRGVYVPRGTYLADQQLFLNAVQGAWVFGDGKEATRILYTGPNSQLPYNTTCLFSCGSVTYSRIEGITFDVTGSNASVAAQLIGYHVNVSGSIGPGSPANFTGSISDGAGGAGTQLVVTGWSGIPIIPNQVLTGAGIPLGTNIIAQVSGTTGQNGTYTVSQSLHVASEAMSSAYSYLTVSSADGILQSGMYVLSGTGLVNTVYPIQGSGSPWQTWDGNTGYSLPPATGSWVIELQNDGTGNVWRDCGFVGASIDGFLVGLGTGQTGSEELFDDCTFDNCFVGLRVRTGNALNFVVLNSRITNCLSAGLECAVGQINVVRGCYFNNPNYASFTGDLAIDGTLTVTSAVIGTIQVGQYIYADPVVGLADSISVHSQLSPTTWMLYRNNASFIGTVRTGVSFACSGIDIWTKQGTSPEITDCYSVSPNFCCVTVPWIAGCIHDPPVPGFIFNSTIAGLDWYKFIIENSRLGPNSGIMGNSNFDIYLRGNRYDNTNYLAQCHGTIHENL